ncbi:hypothetical protein EON65_22440 [archaeon]|nr:MAG: hypothetical protein EON65_22440 [archaeon]
MPFPPGIYFSLTFSLLSNLVYPSLSSLVSRVVAEEEQGEALGAMNGIKALVSIYSLCMTMCMGYWVHDVCFSARFYVMGYVNRV